MASPLCTINGSSSAGGVNVTAGSTVTVALADVGGVKTWSLSVVGTDDVSSAPSLSVNSVTKTATFTAPAAGSAVILKSIVNGGADANGALDPSLTTTMGVYVPTSAGKRVLAVNETVEGSAAHGWIKTVNAGLRGGGRDDVVTVEMLDEPFTDASTLAANARVVIATGEFSEMGGSDVDLMLPLDGKDRVVINATNGGAFFWVRTGGSGNAGVNIRKNESALVVNNDIDFLRVGRVMTTDQSIVITDDNILWATGDFAPGGTVRAGTYAYRDYDLARGGAFDSAWVTNTSTTGALTTLTTIWFPNPFVENNAVFDVTAKIVGRKSTGSGTISVSLAGTYEMSGGALSLVGTIDKTALKTNTAATVANFALAISAKAIDVQANPPDAGPWRWTVMYRAIVRNQSA